MLHAVIFLRAADHQRIAAPPSCPAPTLCILPITPRAPQITRESRQCSGAHRANHVPPPTSLVHFPIHPSFVTFSKKNTKIFQMSSTIAANLHLVTCKLSRAAPIMFRSRPVSRASTHRDSAASHILHSSSQSRASTLMFRSRPVSLATTLMSHLSFQKYFVTFFLEKITKIFQTS